jgi:hypothetical protein
LVPRRKGHCPMAEICSKFSRCVKVGILLIGSGIHGPSLGILDEVLLSGTMWDDWMMFSMVSLGDEIWDGGGSAVEVSVMRYDSLLASMATASGSVIIVWQVGCWN